MFKNSVVTVLTTIFIALLGLTTSSILARGLGPEGRGVFGIYSFAAMLAAGIGQLGLGQAFVFKVRSDKNFKAKSMLALSVCLVTVTTASVSFVFPFTHAPNDTNALLITALFAISYSLIGLATNASQINERLLLYNFLRASVPIVVLVSVIYGQEQHILTPRYLVFIYTVVGCAVAVFGFLNISKSIKTTQKETKFSNVKSSFRKYFSIAIKFHGTTVTGLFLNNIDKIYLYAFSDVKNFGLYIVAFSTSRLASALPEAVATAVYSRYVGKIQSNSQYAISLAFRLIFYPSLCCSIIIAVFGKPLFLIIFGLDFIQIYSAFTILLFESVIGSCGWILAQHFNSDGKPGLIFVRQIIALVPVSFLLIIPTQNIENYLAVILLICSIIRLLVTVVMYKLYYNVNVKSFLPHLKDLSFFRVALKGS